MMDVLTAIYVLFVNLPAYLSALAAGVILLSLFLWALWLNIPRKKDGSK